MNAPAQGNHPPVIMQIIGQTDWPASAQGQFICSATDPDNDMLTYSWIADGGTIIGNGERIYWTSPSQAGKYHITVKASDGRGGEASMSTEIRVLMNADGSIPVDEPVILKIKLPSDAVVTAYKRVRIWTSSPVECWVEDKIDNKNLKYIWIPSNGKLQAKGLTDGVANRVTWIAPGVAGDFTLDVEVSDSNGNSARGIVNFNVFCCDN